MQRTEQLARALTGLPGVRCVFARPGFHEVVLGLDRPAGPVLAALAARGIEGGLDLGEHYPELGPALLVCATETKTLADIDTYARALSEVLRAARAA
jgi:glycine dehydrogenase subunit 1